ncbi:MAG TPA: tRNA preQ1(34) S-adenosylmethionine ribosyltransferase-isomerase QueA [Terriglobia bacterium]
MQLHDFDYDLPPELIAQQPLAERDAARMMLLNRASGRIEDRHFRDLPALLQPGDLLVFNNTRVFPARLLGRRRGMRSQPIGKSNPAAREYLTAEVELLLTRRESEDVWEGLVRPGRKVRTGEVLVFGEGELEAEVLGRGEYGLRRVRLMPRGSNPHPSADSAPAQLLDALPALLDTLIDRLGHVPLPPYIQRPDSPADRDTYQTVYARVRGAVAAPTAGLHFTPAILAELRARGVETLEITLHVGLGTFRPVHTERVEDHRLDAEEFEIGEDPATRLNRARDEGRRVIAVGTTSVRTLEHAVRAQGGRFEPARGQTSLFIYPGFEFQAVSALLTNFHLPRSTLLMLVSAFAGRDFILQAYRHAVDERYRFYSYGDCMLIL